MSQLEFFASPERVLLDDDTGRIVYYPCALNDPAGAFQTLAAWVPWRAERRMMYEREVDVPRLVASVRAGAADAPPVLGEMLVVAERLAQARFTTIGFNLYRDGRDSVAPHNDTLRELRTGEPIALISLGATRRMTIRSKDAPRRAYDLDLDAGSLLVMSYATQLHYDHAIPNTSRAVGARISAAFRVRAEAP